MSDASTITIYGAEWCPPCHMAKAYLKSKGISFQYVNVDEQRQQAQEVVVKTGWTAIPVIQIGDEYLLGFERTKLDVALRAHQLMKIIMAFEGYKTKKSVVIIYTGEGKGKTSASVGLLARALGSGWKAAYIQFIKHWDVGEHQFIGKIQPLFGDNLLFYKGGKGFYDAGDLSAKDVTEDEHKQAAKKTFNLAIKAASSGYYDLVICDEINNAVHHKLITKADLKRLILTKAPETSLCLTGRNFPVEFLPFADIATSMTKLRHHFDDKYLANKGIDF